MKNAATERQENISDFETEIRVATWASDPHFPVEDWKYEVASDDTRLGYWDWVRNQYDL